MDYTADFLEQTGKVKATGETRYAVIDGSGAASTEQRPGATFKLPKSVLQGALKRQTATDPSQERVLQSVIVPSIKTKPLKNSLISAPTTNKASKKPPLAASTAITASVLGKNNRDLAETLDYGVPNIDVNRTPQNVVTAGVKGALRESYTKKRE